jgi:hypothetical protein
VGNDRLNATQRNMIPDKTLLSDLRPANLQLWIQWRDPGHFSIEALPRTNLQRISLDPTSSLCRSKSGERSIQSVGLTHLYSTPQGRDIYIWCSHDYSCGTYCLGRSDHRLLSFYPTYIMWRAINTVNTTVYFTYIDLRLLITLLDMVLACYRVKTDPIFLLVLG